MYVNFSSTSPPPLRKGGLHIVAERFTIQRLPVDGVSKHKELFFRVETDRLGVNGQVARVQRHAHGHLLQRLARAERTGHGVIHAGANAAQRLILILQTARAAGVIGGAQYLTVIAGIANVLGDDLRAV